MLKKTIILILILCLSAFLFLTSCTKQEKGEKKIGISLMNRQQIFYLDLEKSFKENAKSHGIELDITNADMDATKQLNDVEGMIAGGIDALILCPVDSTTSGNIVKFANSKNIPVFTVDIGSHEGDVVCHISSDNIEGGKIAGQFMADLIKEKGNIIILDSPKVTSVQDRVKGFKEVIQKYPDIKILKDIDGGAKKETALETMEYMLQAYENIDGVFAINDETAMGAMLAIENSGRSEISIVGYDATPEARKKIEEGTILKGEVTQNPAKMAEIAIEQVKDYLDGKEVPVEIKTEVNLFTGENSDG